MLSHGKGMGGGASSGGIGCRGGSSGFVAEAAPEGGIKTKLLARRQEAVRARHLSPRTEEAYRPLPPTPSTTLRHSHRPGVIRPQPREDHDDLYPPP